MGSVVSGWTKNTPKPELFEKRNKSSQTQKLKNLQKYAKINDTPFAQRSLIHREAWFPPCFVGKINEKNYFGFVLRFRPLPKKIQIWDHFFPLLFPQGFQISKNIGHPTLGSGGKKTFKWYLKSEQTDGQTHRHTDRRTFWLIESIGPLKIHVYKCFRWFFQMNGLLKIFLYHSSQISPQCKIIHRQVSFKIKSI